MNARRLGQFTVNAVGFGCMGMSHGYGRPIKEDVARTLAAAIDVGYNFFDTAALYGFGENEKLIGNILVKRRNEYVLASKCGLIRGSDGKRSLDARPSVIRKTCEDSLRNLQTDHIDIYYLHRVDPKVSLEDQVGTLADLLVEGKIGSIGLSEVSAVTLRKASAIHPIVALQSEYSLWTRSAENQVLEACKELDISFVAFSPLGRGFLTGGIQDSKSLMPTDLRITMPRFSDENLPKNIALLSALKEIAKSKQCTMAQIALAWILTKHPNMIPIPGTTTVVHAVENFASRQFVLNQLELDLLDKTFHADAIFGERYDKATLASMET